MARRTIPPSEVAPPASEAAYEVGTPTAGRDIRSARPLFLSGSSVKAYARRVASVAALVALDVPVRGERRWIFFTPEAPGLPERLPLTIDFTTSFYFHREGPGLAFGGREQTLEELAVPATKRLPLLAELPIQSSWWGYYEMSPDHNAIVGESDGLSRFLYATGFSGHGFQQSPAVGEHLAELVAGRDPTLDLSPFSLDRFERGEVREEQFVI